MNYDSFATTFSSSRKNLVWPELDFIIEDMGKRGHLRILDIGCGNGRFIEQAQNSDFHIGQYFGIDNSKGMIEEAQRLHPNHTFLHGEMQDASEITYRAGFHDLFDSIVFLASFHHLDFEGDRMVVLHDIKSLLAPKGRIYMTNWNLLDQEKYQDSHRGNGDFDIKIGAYSRYYHGFTLEELEGLFSQAGYKIEENRIFEGGRNILSIIST